MPDTPVRPEPEPEPTIQDRVSAVTDAYRVAVTGNPNARVRRVTWYLLAAIGLGLGFMPLTLVALVALAFTDSVVDLS